MDGLKRRWRARRYPHWPRVMANSMPKAGTNLLIRLLDLLPGMVRGPHIDVGPDQAIELFGQDERDQMCEFFDQLEPGMFGSSHCYWFDELAGMIEERGIKCVTIVRDPRDVCVSDYHYIMDNPGHRLHLAYRQMSSDAERLMASIVGMTTEQLGGAEPSLDIGRHYENFLGWAHWSRGTTVRFEDLIGARGSGDDHLQRDTIEKVIASLGIQLNASQVDRVANKLFSRNAKTFRRGQIGDWRDEFAPEHRMAFARVAGHVLEPFGYER
jgi:hypothetical protein